MQVAIIELNWINVFAQMKREATRNETIVEARKISKKRKQLHKNGA